MEKIIHQIWIGPYEMPDREKRLVENTKEMNLDFQHIFWTDENIPTLEPHIQALCDNFREREDYAFLADVLRVCLVREYGGIYLDVDWKPHKAFNDLSLENYDGVIIYHDTFTTGNEVFGSKSKNGFIEYAYQELFKGELNHEFGPYWFNQKLRHYFNTEVSQDETSEENKVVGLEFLETLKRSNIRVIKRHGEFEKIYSEHLGLHSWCHTHKEFFKEGNINYQQTVYNREWN
jgi:mannosyltransferase OCH1-like enzyme